MVSVPTTESYKGDQSLVFHMIDSSSSIDIGITSFSLSTLCRDRSDNHMWSIQLSSPSV